MLDAGKIAFELGKELGFGPALQHFAKKASARGKHFAGEIRGRFRKSHDAQMVGLPVARRVRRHVGKHQVGATAEHGLQALRRSLVEKIELEKIDTRDWLHVQNIKRDHASTRTDTPRRDFAPAARRRAEVNDARARFQQMIFVVDLGELIGRAGAKSLTLGTGDIRIFDLALQPCARRRLAALFILEPRHDPSGFAPDAVGTHHFDQHALAQAAIGDAQPRARKRAADGVEDGAAGKH